MSRHWIQIAGRQARVTRLVVDSVALLAVATDTSRVAGTVTSVVQALTRSWLASAIERGSSRGAAGGSRILSSGSRLAAQIAETGRRALATATVAGVARWTEAAVRTSWGYRWLTAEPEPEVIVIDLRETISVGPVIALLDRFVRWIVPASHRSMVVEAGRVIHTSVKAAPVRAASFVLVVALLANLTLTLFSGEPTQGGVLARVVLLGLAALGTRISMPWNDLIETRAVRLIVAALEPPEPPEEWDER